MNKSSIIFLGTGGDIEVVGKQIRSSGGIVLNLDGNQFLLDPGPGCLNNAKRCDINLRETIAIFASNRDILLSNDINAAVAAMTLNGLDRTGVLIGSKSVIGDDENKTPILLPEYKEMVERVLSVPAKTKIGINEIDVYTLPTKSKDENAIGFKFVTSSFSVGYTSLTGFTPEVAEGLKGCGIMIINCKNHDEDKDTEMNISYARELVVICSPKLVILTFFGKKAIDANPITLARQLKLETGVPTISATDNMIIDPSNYNLSSDQKDKQEATEKKAMPPPQEKQEKLVLEQESKDPDDGSQDTEKEEQQDF